MTTWSTLVNCFHQPSSSCGLIQLPSTSDRALVAAGRLTELPCSPLLQSLTVLVCVDSDVACLSEAAAGHTPCRLGGMAACSFESKFDTVARRAKACSRTGQEAGNGDPCVSVDKAISSDFCARRATHYFTYLRDLNTTTPAHALCLGSVTRGSISAQDT